MMSSDEEVLSQQALMTSTTIDSTGAVALYIFTLLSFHNTILSSALLHNGCNVSTRRSHDSRSVDLGDLW